MELKSYQRAVLNDIKKFASIYAEREDVTTAWNIYFADAGLTPGKSEGVAKYRDSLNGAPRVCVKVPTGGGKTFIGVNAIKTLINELPARNEVVLWFVPRKEILRQTLRQFRDPAHFARMTLDRDFQHRVSVLDKEDGLRARGFNATTVRDGLTLFVLSYDSFKNRDGRRAFQENSGLASLTAQQRTEGTAVEVENADETALITALAGTNPIVVVDESHHATSALSEDMLRNLNPRFVLELTATPSRNANVVSQATARELKAEQMVKLPVVVYRRNGKQQVVQDAIALQRRLEQITLVNERVTGDYIRPVVLFQAERRDRNEAETYLRLKKKLADAGIPEEQIAIRTGDVDELGDANLMARECPIRFIITVDALAEGWDCPFAYVLATVANKNSQVSVEQIVGRVLRQPYAHRASAPALNVSYVLTASEDFDATLDQVVAGLNGVGFLPDDVVEGKSAPGPAPTAALFSETEAASNSSTQGINNPPIAPETEGPDNIDDFEFAPIPAADDESGTNTDLDGIIANAESVESVFTEEVKEEYMSRKRTISGLGGGSNVYGIRPAVLSTVTGLRIPQYFGMAGGGLFSDFERIPFDRKYLLADFDLSGYGTNVVEFDSSDPAGIRAVDLAEDSDSYRIRQLSPEYLKSLRTVFDGQSEEGKIETVKANLYDRLTSQTKSTYGEPALKAFIVRIVERMPYDQLGTCFDNASSYARAIQAAIDRLSRDFCREKFNDRTAMGNIELEPFYEFPKKLIQTSPLKSYDRPLYEAEDADMNGFERKMVDRLANCESIVWWHRVKERREGEFYINGFINHYPDFLAMTTDRTVLAIETKGGDRTNADSRAKLELGTRWADAAGSKYRYFMVFDGDKLDERNSYTMAEFGNILG